MKIYKLTIETIRHLTEEEYQEYKKITPLQVNWKELENTGSAIFKTDDAHSLVMLEDEE